MNDAEGSFVGSIVEVLGEAVHEALLIEKLGGRDGARAIENHHDVHRLATLASIRRREGGRVNGGVGLDIRDCHSAEIVKAELTDHARRIDPKVRDVAGGGG